MAKEELENKLEDYCNRKTTLSNQESIELTNEIFREIKNFCNTLPQLKQQVSYLEKVKVILQDKYSLINKEECYSDKLVSKINYELEFRTQASGIYQGIYPNHKRPINPTILGVYTPVDTNLYDFDFGDILNHATSLASSKKRLEYYVYMRKEYKCFLADKGIYPPHNVPEGQQNEYRLYGDLGRKINEVTKELMDQVEDKSTKLSETNTQQIEPIQWLGSDDQLKSLYELLIKDKSIAPDNCDKLLWLQHFTVQGNKQVKKQTSKQAAQIKPIKWCKTTKLIVYFFKLLINDKLIESKPDNKGDNRHVLVVQHFLNNKDTQFDRHVLGSSLYQLDNTMPRGGQKYKEIIKKVKSNT